MAKSFQFAHLLKHARHRYQCALRGLKFQLNDPCSGNALTLAAEIGALNCLYYQALGCEEVLLAKSIHRRLNRIDLGLSEVTGQSY